MSKLFPGIDQSDYCISSTYPIIEINFNHCDVSLKFLTCEFKVLDYSFGYKKLFQENIKDKHNNCIHLAVQGRQDHTLYSLSIS